MRMKLLSHLMKLLHLMTLPNQQFYLCGTLFNVHDTLICMFHESIMHIK